MRLDEILLKYSGTNIQSYPGYKLRDVETSLSRQSINLRSRFYELNSFFLFKQYDPNYEQSNERIELLLSRLYDELIRKGYREYDDSD